ncbi:MAG: molecular chaperone DnaK [Planctomycetota bacterium]|nr:molecular chaperone DnaK [Planctomycetota bacterium]
MSRIVGIDLGTTNSVAAIMDASVAQVVTNPEGMRTTPSVVAFAPDGRLVGETARRQATTNPSRTVFSVKRLMGRRYSECSDLEHRIGPEVREDESGMAALEIADRLYSPPEISAMILRHLRSSCEDFTGEKISESVITVPAYFNDSQRQATRASGKIAGLNVRRIINEPTAAALAYGINKSYNNARVAVFDLGGGTFDISILELGGGMFEVLATSGNTELGGEDYDRVLLDYVIDEFRSDHGIDLRNDPVALQRLKEAVERAKHELSTKVETQILQPFICSTPNGTLSLDMKISRAKFEALTEHLTRKCIEPCEKCIEDAGLNPREIDEVLLVGGSTRMPAIQAVVEKIFGRVPRKGINPDEVVALGAAIQGGILAGELDEVLLLDVTPLTLGIETMGEVMTPIIPRNTTIPVRRKETFSTAYDGQRMVEVHVLQGERKMTKDNRTLGTFKLTGIEPQPRGVPQIEVVFDIDANGILTVTAFDKKTDKKTKIEVSSSSGLSEQQIQKLVKEAREFESRDKELKRIAEVRNQADARIYEVRKYLERFGDKLEKSSVDAIERALDALKSALKDGSLQDIEQAQEVLAERALVLSRMEFDNGAREQSDKARKLRDRDGSRTLDT